jgi:maltose O-acetyltransferase
MGLSNLLFVTLRRVKYNWLSTAKRVTGTPIKHQPLLLNGLGELKFGEANNFGVIRSPHYYTGYSYIEAREATASVTIGQNFNANNNLSIIADQTLISIGDNVVCGYNVQIVDSNFHDLHTKDRMINKGNSAPVKINNNVFIGNNVVILKGVVIGENAVIGSNAIVTKDVPSNAIMAGNPAVQVNTVTL